MGLVRGVQALYLAGLAPAWARFARAAAAPEAAQRRRLGALLARNGATSYGAAHGFDRIRSVSAYQDRVPIVGWDELAPWVQRVARGEAAVLSAEPVRALERTSGSAREKLIPYTQGLLDEIAASTHAWIWDLYRRCPGLRGTVAYWSVSPVARRPERTEGGLPIGFEDDTAYFNPLLGWALRRTLAVPPSVARLPSIDAWRWQTARHLVAAADLGLFSVWSPTFLTLLMRFVEAHLDPLLWGVPAPRAREIRAAIDREGRVTGEAIWPRLALISCWADGASRHFVPELARWFPRTPLQPKGLLATEGVVSFPLWGREGAVAAVSGHFLELVDLDRPSRRPRLLHELEVGAVYSPLLSTAGGLYRYRLGDVVRCVGRHRATPTLRFEGKLDRTSDLCGEKLDARGVDEALAEARRRTGLRARFAMLAPLRGQPPRYALFAETDDPDDVLARAAAIVEAELGRGHHYRYCRDLGQLGPVRGVRVREAWAAYHRVLTAEGARLGSVKPTPLDGRTSWADAFGVTEAAS